MAFIWYILIGLVAGWLAGLIMKGGGYGFLINILVGIVGGVFGGWVFGLLGFAASGIVGNLITAIIGAILLIWIVSLFTSKKKK